MTMVSSRVGRIALVLPGDYRDTHTLNELQAKLADVLGSGFVTLPDTLSMWTHHYPEGDELHVEIDFESV